MNNGSFTEKRIHIALLVLAAVIFALFSINTNIWFDECYSLAAVSHDISELPGVLMDDVHPFLYYFMLKAVSVVCGGSLIAMRLFSALGMWLLCLAGYTHIRRYISPRMGLFFSLFCCLSPAGVKYAAEIRMYSFGALFVFFSAFYAYLAVQSSFKSRKDCILFVIFSVAAAYMHYYGLVTVCVINVFFIVGAVIKKAKALPVVACAASELLLYIPGFIVFLTQSTRVAAGDYWIQVKYPDVILQTMSYAFTGGDSYWDTYMSKPAFVAVCAVGCVLFALAAYAAIRGAKKKKKEALAAVLALGVFCGVVVLGLAVSVFKEFYYVRYSMLPCGLLLAVYAYAASEIHKKQLVAGLCAVLSAVFAAVTVPHLIAVHNGDFGRVRDSLNEAFDEDDILVFGRLTPGSVVSYMLDGGRQYFVNSKIDEYPRAYTAFEPDIVTVPDFESLPDSVEGKIWLLVQDSNEDLLVAGLESRYPTAEVADVVEYSVLYRHNNFKFIVYTLEG